MSEYYAFDNSPMPQAIIDPVADVIVRINKPAAELFWATPDQLTGQHFSPFFNNHFDGLMVFTQAVLEQGHYWSSDLSITNHTGELGRDLEISAGIAGSAPHSKLHLYLQDIHEIDRKRATATAHKHYLSGLSHWQRVERFFQEVERDNQLILNAAGEGIYGVDAKGCTTFVNPVAEELLGWTADELAGKEIHKIIHHTHEHGDEYEKSSCPIYAAFQDGSVHRVVDEVFWHKKGHPIPVEYTSTPIKDNGYLVGAVVVFRDVTMQKNAQQSLLEALTEVETLKQKLEQENAYLQEEMRVDYNHREIVGKSAAIQKVIQQIELVGPTDATVLVTGESGTGKELIARAIHQASKRSQRPLIRVNCAAIPRDIFESEFFGHVRGAFTGAVGNRVGRFELADGGTIFLDEIGELPLDLQGKLLRVLQEQQFERVGDASTKTVDVRVIAATNQDLLTQVEQKLFRKDLYFRLNVFPIELPPLRERHEDIALLAMHFLEKTKQKFNRPNGTNKPLDNDELLMTEPERKQLDRVRIIEALKRSKGKVFGEGGAADLLHIKPTTLSSRIKKHKIDARAYKQQP